MTIIVAITGGIGSGKSTFSKEVVKRGFDLLDSDKLVAEIYKNPTISFLKHLKNIGLGTSIERKKINKKIISNIIFSNKKIKLRLERYIFKVVRQKRKKFIEIKKKQKNKIVFLDIPLLFENKLNKKFDIVISIISTRKNRFIRLKKSKKITKFFFNKILKSQTSDLDRKKNSDILIFNNNSIEEYLTKINKTLDKITK